MQETAFRVYTKDKSGFGRFFTYYKTVDLSTVVVMGRDPVEHAKRAKYKPPAMRVRDDCYTKKSPFRYNKVVQANL